MTERDEPATPLHSRLKQIEETLEADGVVIHVHHVPDRSYVHVDAEMRGRGCFGPAAPGRPRVFTHESSRGTVRITVEMLP